MLARNETGRQYAYNRRLFKRLSTGLYQFNPELALRRRGNEGAGWLPAFGVLNLPLVKELADPLCAERIDTLLMLAGVARAPEAFAYQKSSVKRLASTTGAKQVAASARRPLGK